MSLIRRVKFRIEARNYSLSLEKVKNTSPRSFLIIRLYKCSFWRCILLNYDQVEKSFLFQMLDDIESKELYYERTDGMELSLTADTYRKEWYIVNHSEEISLDNWSRLEKIVKYIRENSFES